MNISKLVFWKVFSIVMLFLPFNLFAKEEEKCIVFSGVSSTTQSLSIAEFNRIKMSPSAFIISSTDKNISDVIELPYDDFNHLEFKETIPTISAIIESLVVAPQSTFFYNAELKQLDLSESDNSECEVLVVSLDGKLMLKSCISFNCPISVAHLMPGIYIAIAKKKNQTIKFYKK